MIFFIQQNFYVYYFSLYLPGYANVIDRHDEFDARPKTAGSWGIYGNIRGHDDVFATWSTEIFVEWVNLANLIKRYIYISVNSGVDKPIT